MNQSAVLVTGGSRGIGAEIVRALAKRNVPVCFNYLSGAEAAKALAGELEAQGHKYCLVQADVADPQSVERMFAEATQALGPLGGLVNNACFVGKAGRKVENLDYETLRKTFDVNVIGAFLCAQQAVRHMATSSGGKGGRIINVSSIAARTGSPNDWVDYAASKAAMDALTLGLARETAQQGIRVTGVAPAGVATDLHANAGAPERVERFSHITPIGRAAHPGEIADVVLWALLDAPDYLTSSTIEVTGGL
ncbi:MAG: SDR family NAD(P)-dependent oxidoreductase [Burkholderiaceae bacterium]